MSLPTDHKDIEILNHNIAYWYEDDQDMPEHEQAHISQLIIEGYSQGQLVDGEDGDNTGWWEIKNKDIVEEAAYDLLAALKEVYDLLEENQDDAPWYTGGHYKRLTSAINKATVK